MTNLSFPFDPQHRDNRFIAYIDGGARGNPGPAGFGVRIEREDGTVVAEFGEPIGMATNNVAEYRGLLAALQWARAHRVRNLHIRSDSQLLVEQMLGRYKVKHPGLQPLHAEAQAIAKDVGRVTFEHVPRSMNAHADRLANLAMDAASDAVRPDAKPRSATADIDAAGSPFTPVERRVRAFIYKHFVDTTHAPDIPAVAAHAGVDGPTAVLALRQLAERHAIVLAPASTAIWMAHPFSAVPTRYPVAAIGRRYYANCALDAAGILSLLDADGDARTRCADCAVELSMRVERGQLTGDGVVHVAVPPRRFWENVAFT